MLTVGVKLKNPPVEGELWYLYIWDFSKADVRSYIGALIMDEIRFEDLPDNWEFPSPFFLLIYLVGGQQIYAIQSWDPTFAYYKADLYIPSSGSYYFNCATEYFEKVITPEFSKFAIKDYSKV